MPAASGGPLSMSRVGPLDAALDGPIESVSRFEWERVVRRVYMPPTTKLLALTMATYADADGSRIRPGAERLARVMCVSEPTVKRSLAWLRAHGLVHRAKQGNRWAKQADEYRLTVPEKLLAMRLLDPEEREGLEIIRAT
ncbi:MAG: helix-turn-helix domain-containing protein [Rhodococcus sp. (in: high G+C Gram-positive bacteria)]